MTFLRLLIFAILILLASFHGSMATCRIFYVKKFNTLANGFDIAMFIIYIYVIIQFVERLIVPHVDDLFM